MMNLETIKSFLRPPWRRLRRNLKPKVFWVHRSRESSRSKLLQTRESDSPEFLFLSRQSPPNWSQVFADTVFKSVGNPPCPDTDTLPLIDVFTETGVKFLSLTHCPITGVVFHQLLPPFDWQHAFYESQWDSASRLGESVSPDKILKNRPNMIQRMIGTKLSSNSRVLDVGCGFGDQLLFFKQSGCKVVGIEPSRHRATYVRKQLDIEVLNCPIENEQVEILLKNRGERFDLIYLNQVFEHLYNPVHVARLLGQFLSDKGILLIGTPSFFSESMANYFCSIVHTHSFTANSLENLLTISGYSKVDDYSFPGYLYMAFMKEKNPILKPKKDPLTREVVKYVFKHFDLLSDEIQIGDVISIISEHTGHTKTSLLTNNLGHLADCRQFLKYKKSSNIDEISCFLPIKIIMPFQKPTVWLK